MKQILAVIQIVICLLLVITVLFQSQGQGLGGLGGGGGELFQSRRGFEKVLFRLTIVLASAFLISSLIQFWLS